MADDTTLFHEYEEWNLNLEQLVKKEGEQSQSLFWLHNEASKLAATYNDRIQIPGIILASVTGFLSATSNIVPPIGIGAMSLVVGVLNTINSYYKFSQAAEAHKISARLYLKMYKNIRTELALPVKQRANANILLQNIRDKLARISEIAPQIPNRIIDMYKKKFKDAKISKPIIANGLDPIDICVEESSSNTTTKFSLNTPKNDAFQLSSRKSARNSIAVPKSQDSEDGEGSEGSQDGQYSEKSNSPKVVITEPPTFDNNSKESPKVVIVVPQDSKESIKPYSSPYPSALKK
jgi:hypothetical protein